jgi:DNA repair protein RadC
MAEQVYAIPVSHLEEAERPRERLLRFGPDLLRNHELLAIILNTGYRREGVLELSRRIVQEYGSKAIAEERSVERLRSLLGLPLVKACQVVATFELGRRFYLEEPGRLPALRTPEEVFRYAKEMEGLTKEQFRGLYLNARNKVIHDETISIGTLTANLVHPREVFRPAFEYACAALITVHNHPSGDPAPSEEDIALTRQLVQVSRIMGIELLDHVIIGRGAFASLKEMGKI